MSALVFVVAFEITCITDFTLVQSLQTELRMLVLKEKYPYPSLNSGG